VTHEDDGNTQTATLGHQLIDIVEVLVEGLV
jgi:hypothetical protein